MATTGRIVYHGDDETIKKEKREFSLTDEIMELINSGGGGGAINGVKVNGQVVNPDQAGYVGLTIPGVINNLSSNSTSDALSAKQGKVLYEYIQALQHVGHFLALWNTATGLPVTNPETSPYNYNTGDYYIVSNVAAAGGTNYKPNGSSYTINVASTTVESGDVQVNDIYFYDGYERRLLDNSGGGSSIAIDSSLSTTSTNPVQNSVITNRLNQMALDANTKTFWLANLQDTTTAQAIRDWVDGGGNAIVYYGGMPYYMTAKSATRITLYSKFTGTQNSPSSQSTGFTEQLMWIDNDGTNTTVTNTAVGLGAPYLATNQNYSTVYTPLYDGSPATKKYVDDKFSAVPVYTAGSNIDITSNQISTIRNGYVYVTCNDAASTKAKTGTSAEGNYTPQEGDLIMIHFVNGCGVGGPTISIDGGSAIPFYIGTESANAVNLYFGSTNVSKMFIYTNGRLVGDAVTDRNNTYSAGTGLTLTNGVFSVDTTTIATQSDINTKTFYLTSTSDLTTAQAVVDWYLAGKNPLIMMSEAVDGPDVYEDKLYKLYSHIIEADEFSLGFNELVFGDNEITDNLIYIEGTISNGVYTVTTITNNTYSSDWIPTFNNAPYTPTNDYNPSTKKYVDDKVKGAISSGTTAPSSPTEGQLWYDTTNDVLKSYDGTTWNIVGGGSADLNTKTFYLSSTSDTTNAQAAYDWYAAGKNPVIVYNDVVYILYEKTSTYIKFVSLSGGTSDVSDGTSYEYLYGLKFNLSSSTVSSISNSNARITSYHLRTGFDYPTPYTPQYNGSPATKKYVDDKMYSGTTAPSNPTEGQLWYDTTNDELKVYDGTTWNVTGGGIKLAANSPLTVTEIWAGTETQYNNLSSKGATTAYLCVEE